MKIKTLIIIFITAICAFSCSNDDNNFLNYDNNSFVYIETLVYDDYSGDSQLLISNGNQTTPIITSNGTIQYQIVNSRIVYKNGYDIIEFNPTNHQTQILASLPNVQINSFNVSPNYEYLAFSNYEDIFLLNLASGVIENLTANIEGDFRFPKWSPDGGSILIRNGIPIIRPGDSAPTATGNFKIFYLSQRNFQNVEMYDQFASPSYADWSPDSKNVVYEQSQAIFIFDVVTEQLRRITTEEVVATNPKFSNDGGMISYFSSDLSDNGNNWQNFLTLYDIEKESNEIINNIYSYDVSWKDDSSEILYGTETGIFSYNITNGTITKKVSSNQSTYVHSVNFIN